MTVTFIVASNASFTIPGTLTKVECVAGGGAGQESTNTNGEGGGGGAGAYASNTNATFLTLSGNVNVGVGAAGTTVGAAGGDSWFNATSLANAVTNGTTVSCAAQHGTGAGTVCTVSAAGGAAASSVGTTTNSGGGGGNALGTPANNPGGDGGGGSGGPQGAGGKGGSGDPSNATTNPYGAGGGGGSGGGGSGTVGAAGGNGATAGASGNAGGAGGNNAAGSGSGAAGGVGAAGTGGTVGGGGGGAGSTTGGTTAGTAGGNGGDGQDWDSTHGVGGGGGGTAMGSGGTAPTAAPGNGGKYGGGGGGSGGTGSTKFGQGAQGIVVVTTAASGSPMGWFGAFPDTQPLLYVAKDRTRDYAQFTQGPFAGTSPALSSPWVQAPLFEPTKLKPTTQFEWNAPGTSPRLSSPYVQAPYFEPTRLKQPIIVNPDIMPNSILGRPMDWSPFWEKVPLKPKLAEGTPYGPGTSPALASPYVQAPFFEPDRPKKPFINISDNVPPFPLIVSGLPMERWFDPVALRRILVEAPPIIPGTNPALSDPRSFDLWFEPVRLKQPIVQNPDIVPPLPVAAQYSLSNWFDQVRKLLVAEGFTFTQATAQANTVLYALVDWFDRVQLKQPLVETPGIFYYPAQVIPPPTPTVVVQQQVLRGGQWDPSNWYVRSEEAVRREIRRAILKAMGRDVGEEKAGRVAAEFANSAANPHLESLLPGHEAEYLSHFVRANAHAVHAAINRVEAQERDDEEAVWLLAEDERERTSTIFKLGRER